MSKAKKPASSLPILVAMMLVVLLGMGVYGANLFNSHLLVKRSLEQSVSANLAPIIDVVRSSRADASPQIPDTSDTQDFGLRLRGNQPAQPSTEQVPQAQSEHSALDHHQRQVTEKISNLFGEASILASVKVNFADAESQEEVDAAIAKALEQCRVEFETFGVSFGPLKNAFYDLATMPEPFITVDFSLSGNIKPAIFVSVPIIDADGHSLGGYVYLTDQTPLINEIANISLIGLLLVGVLCGASILFAVFVTWYRVRDLVKVNRDIEFLAHHDTLTGLPNRAVYNAKLNEGLRLAQAKASNMAAMLIDVDKFKDINDTYGHGTGDIFLQIIADRLREVFKDHLVSRLSGDEFAVMVTAYSDVGRLTKLAADMIAATEQPCVIDGKEIKISLSIGIARASDGSWRTSRLLHCADLALYRAKHSGRSTFVWYSPEMDADAQRRKEIEGGLVKALKFDQFQLVFQPQYSLIDNQLKGYESLIRWEHPTKGAISPEVFIPVAEETGMIEDIGNWVLNHACMEAARWSDKSLKIAVNVSPAQFLAGRTDLKVKKALEMSGLAPERLEIEITESLLISNPDAVVETLHKIHAMGVSIAMDDFGTGYSSLSYLSRFPFDKIKIDRSFIQNLGEEPSLDAVVSAIIGLGHSLDVQITAEGVETEEQVILLRSAGCHLVQGFLFGRPGTVASHEAKRTHFQRSPITSDGRLQRYNSQTPAPVSDPQPITDVPDDLEEAFANELQTEATPEVEIKRSANTV